MMAVYSGTLFGFEHERKLLEVKLAEESGWIHRVAEGTTSFRGHPRAILDASSIVCDTSKIRGRGRLACKRRNAIQRNATLSANLNDDDVFVFSDLDEIIHRQDLQLIEDKAREFGLIRLSMRLYYGKLNRQKIGFWHKPLAFSGRWFNSNGLSVHDIRASSIGQLIETRGQHFTWLYKSEAEVRLKMSNHGHPESDRPSRFRNILAGKGPKGQDTTRVDIDSTYPRAILDNLEDWKEFIE